MRDPVAINFTTVRAISKRLAYRNGEAKARDIGPQRARGRADREVNARGAQARRPSQVRGAWPRHEGNRQRCAGVKLEQLPARKVCERNIAAARARGEDRRPPRVALRFELRSRCTIDPQGEAGQDDRVRPLRKSLTSPPQPTAKHAASYCRPQPSATNPPRTRGCTTP